MSTFLVKILEANHYFDSDISSRSGDANEQDKIFIGSLILRNLQILQFNSHEIFDLLKSVKTGLRQTVAIGAGLFTTLALFNHSCNPSIVRCVDFTLKSISVACTLLFSRALPQLTEHLNARLSIGTSKTLLYMQWLFEI